MSYQARGRGRGLRGSSGDSSSASGRMYTSRGTGRGTRGGASHVLRIFQPQDGSSFIADSTIQQFESTSIPPSSRRDLNLQNVSIARRTPLRPGYGTRGDSVRLWTNYFHLIPSPRVSIFRYSVSIDPEVQNRRTRARILSLAMTDTALASLAPGIVSDFQATILSSVKLQAHQLHIGLRYRNEDEPSAESNSKQYRLNLTINGCFAVADLIDYITSSNAGASLATKSDIIQALNIIVNHLPKTRSSNDALSTRQNVHFLVNGASSERYDLGAGLVAWRGYCASVRAAAARMLVNVQIKHGAMYKSARLDDLITDHLQSNRNNFAELAHFLRHVRVSRLHLKRSSGARAAKPRSICGLASPRDGRNLPNPPKVPALGATAKQTFFFLGIDPPGSLSPNAYISVFDFFNKVHGITANARLPVVNIGTVADPSYLPPEVCFVLPAQPALGKLSSEQTAQMIRFAVRRPFENAESITRTGLANVGLATTNPAMAAFGLEANTKLLAVTGRVLRPPSLRYANNKLAHPRFGGWNMGGLMFYKGAYLDRWSVIWLKSRRGDDVWQSDHSRLVATLKDFLQDLNQCGIRASAPLLPGKDVDVDAGYDELAIESAFREILGRKRKERLLLVILPRHDDGMYNKIKQCGDVQFGVHTVCVVAPKFAKQNNSQYFANVALKINLKLGGQNQALDSNMLGFIAKGDTMVIGIDVTHPSPGSEKTAPSVAAMVASTSKSLEQFLAVINTQTGRQEMVNDLGTMLKSRLSLWRRHNNDQLPRNILAYRDGVSEGQYHLVLDRELPLLQQACRETYPAKSKQPAISIIVVGKRHHTRFYPATVEPGKIDERSLNPIHGTIVDRGITEPSNWDFFLQAHTALQGTARPAHYFVIYDEIFQQISIPPGFSHASDVLEDLTHKLCYMFGRATKAVSLCPPAYYADLVAERSRCYLSHLFSPSVSQAGHTTSESSTKPDDPAAIQIHDSIKDTMFYI